MLEGASKPATGLPDRGKQAQARTMIGTRTLIAQPLGNRLTVDPRTLTPLVLVRIQVPQPILPDTHISLCPVVSDIALAPGLGERTMVPLYPGSTQVSRSLQMRLDGREACLHCARDDWR